MWMRLLLKVSYLQLCHDQVMWDVWDWKLGKGKEILILYSSFRGFTELILLCLPRWVGCQWSKPSWWEGDGKCPGKGKAPLPTWPCIVWNWKAKYPTDPSPHTSLQSWKPTEPFSEANQYSRIPLATNDSWDTSSLHPSQLGDALALPWELHGHPGNVG